MQLNPLRIFANIWRHRYLLGQLVKRDVLLRYRGAMFGVLWVFLSPLLMLSIFAFVFGSIFQARWPQQHESIPFWIVMYSGLIVFNMFAETVTRAPSAVRAYPGYVKKIIFPLEILPLVPLGSALIHGAFNFLILLAAMAWVGKLHGEVLLFPLLLIPALLLAIGGAWFLASWGVFIKDMSQIVPVLVQMLMFLSPVFYPVSAAPELLRPLYLYNPLGAVIGAGHSLIIGESVQWTPWGLSLIVGGLVAVLGYAFFMRSREEFADVL